MGKIGKAAKSAAGKQTDGKQKWKSAKPKGKPSDMVTMGHRRLVLQTKGIPKNIADHVANNPKPDEISDYVRKKGLKDLRTKQAIDKIMPF